MSSDIEALHSGLTVRRHLSRINPEVLILNSKFLPVNRKEMLARGWSEPDFVYVCGDAYVDHPSFGHAIISRVLEKAGYKVAMLCLPDWHSAEPFKEFGRPRLGFLVSSGVIDSMVNHYTVAKKKRSQDAYAPGGKAGMRPDRATVVYCNRIHEAYSNIPILIGGVEASLRRFSHYDYWDDSVRHSILIDSGATLLMFGMGEKSILECAEWVRNGMDPDKLSSIRGICYLSKTEDPSALRLASHDEVKSDRYKYAESFLIQYNEQDPIRGKRLCQKQDTDRYLIQNLPSLPLTEDEMDAVYALPYVRRWHPSYDALGGVPALQEVEFSIASTRGCFGSCNFCAITFHQGRIVQSRSQSSMVKEAELLTAQPNFKGYIHDVGGPTANFLQPACSKQLKMGTCKNRHCLFPTPCKNIEISHRKLVGTLKAIRAVPKVKKVFIRSGIRFDYLMADKDKTFMKELCANHISGQLKVAPEHVCPYVLDLMGKPRHETFENFVRSFNDTNRALGLKQYMIPYLMSSHPGSDLSAAVELACYLNRTGFYPEQVQDFYPTPGTLSTCMFYTGLDPRTMREVYVARSPEEKRMQRALMQHKDPRNANDVRKALHLAGRHDLIGFERECLIRPAIRSSDFGKKTPPHTSKHSDNKSSSSRTKTTRNTTAPQRKKNAESSHGRPRINPKHHR